ncbi:phosphopentomutase [Bosea sp. SSUT16]|uniref:Phosphopentomutase n=1 Tax=Bosea spartocytisi TaxID=2773451 RepID=A0A927E9H0_9HYPH|nr:phosphopentomutase [Bosea spartocytisi]MBD3846818.1 phosphopentomutase [Bosea spartocytisi]MCT4473546.1 phosphopentomutase [Bosea spartocytisi]
MARALLIVLDSVGCGAAEDAGAYGDAGSDTLGHIAQACAEGRGDREGLRSGPLNLPNLFRLGLAHACEASTGRPLAGVAKPAQPQGRWGYGVEVSQGKDTPSGHWEIAGCPVSFRWGYFTALENSFPAELVAGIVKEGSLPGILGNRHASGVAIIDELAAEHIRTGKPICYTSVDSVLQIAAHEEHFGLDRLYALCRTVRTLVDPLRIGRVIARPFTGSPEEGFTRTGNRKDFAIPPPQETILDRLAALARPIVTVGKIGDIFAHRATGVEIKPFGNAAMVEAALEAWDGLPDGGFCFVNLVDFDTEFGHRRDVPGYAAALEAFDRLVPHLEAALRPGDIAVITADHGNDPTWPGTDHTREHVPILAFGPGIPRTPLGRRESFADIAASLGIWLGIGPVGPGRHW